MRYVRFVLVVLFGILMACGYFALLMVIAGFTETYVPSFDLPVFLMLGVVLALGFMRAQTEVERMFIQRHVKKHPGSAWRYTT